jgi:hypothetical protein
VSTFSFILNLRQLSSLKNAGTFLAGFLLSIRGD